MAREFNVPPVVFHSGQTAIAPHHRRPPAAAPNFHPLRPSTLPGSNPTLPFMSFDIGAAQPPSSFSAAPVFSGGATSSINSDEEPPLLEELGINTRHIWKKTVSILIPFRPSSNLHEDADLFGPFLYLITFGLFQLLAGKFHFGIILGWVTISALFIYAVFNMLAGRSGSLDLYRCLSLVGYCMLPMVIFSAISLLVPRGGAVMFAMGAVFGLWSTKTCARLLVELASYGEENRGLVAYACWIVYALFSLLIIF